MNQQGYDSENMRWAGCEGLSVDIVDVAFRELVDSQKVLGKSELVARQAKLLGPRGRYAEFAAALARQRSRATAFNELRNVVDPARREEAERAAAFLLSADRDASDNPFSAFGRKALCCVVYDSECAYTLIERYAALDALRQMDSAYFARLIATTRHSVERRIVFQGLIEHFDSLLPIEQSIYPDNYRDVQQRQLDREVKLYGPLSFPRPIAVMLETLSARQLLVMAASQVVAPMNPR